MGRGCVDDGGPGGGPRARNVEMGSVHGMPLQMEVMEGWDGMLVTPAQEWQCPPCAHVRQAPTAVR